VPGPEAAGRAGDRGEDDAQRRRRRLLDAAVRVMRRRQIAAVVAADSCCREMMLMVMRMVVVAVVQRGRRPRSGRASHDGGVRDGRLAVGAAGTTGRRRRRRTPRSGRSRAFQRRRGATGRMTGTGLSGSSSTSASGTAGGRALAGLLGRFLNLSTFGASVLEPNLRRKYLNGCRKI